jgi:hypothetical protein
MKDWWINIQSRIVGLFFVQCGLIGDLFVQSGRNHATYAGLLALNRRLFSMGVQLQLFR